MAPKDPTATGSPRGRSSLVLWISALAILVGSFLPWVGRDGRTASGWDLPILSLLKGRPAGGVRAGPILLAVALVLVVLALVRRRTRADPGPGVAFLISAVPVDAGFAAVMAAAMATPDLDLGAGAVLTLAGGVLLSIGALVMASRARAAARDGRT